MPAGRPWTHDELIIALEFYYNCPENNHTDAHPACQEVAETIGRIAGGLDGILRNVKFVDQGEEAGFPNASQAIRDLVAQYKNDQNALRAEATRIRNANGWPSLACLD